ncbi:hypothetical protein LTR94_007761 [Friedmanniomyces endolithicus]|nr:hypothetical protein LTR94_007761 [Friedmanniomyces endolithicus]KAK0817383.1 hypothetical protein LTR75_003122 [Friedmanniomyces endolithicus]KAK0847471.1 hypothetical protein LTR03_006256 [Friedmanniomyces endolithicus]
MPALGRKRRAEREDEDDGSPEPATQGRRRTTQNDNPSDEDDTGYGNGNGDSDSNAEQMVKKLVRLALACEYSRLPLRRQMIREKVLGSAGRQFKPVFEQAQLQLRSVFGMEMVELPEKEKVTLAQKRGIAAKTQSQSQSKTAQSYTLVSLLPAPFQDPAILPPPSIPTQATEAQYTSLYTLLVSLVALSGDELADTKMERYLRRLGLEDHTPIPGYTKTELLLKRMEKEGYLVKVREIAGGQGEEDVSWMVGPRGKVEVGEQGVRGLVKAVYGDVDGYAEAELERRVARSLGLGDAVVARRDDIPPKKKRGPRRKNGEAEEAEVESDEED